MRIVLTGGVTGGHIYPAIAIAERFKEADPSTEVIYIASGHPLEREIIPEAGYELFEVDCEPFYRHNIKKIALTLSRNLKGRSAAIRIMKKFKPDVVISTGSYVSVPVVLAAKHLKVPVYLHEQNGFPGVSNKVLARFAERIFLGFESAARYFEDKSKIVYSGNPVRAEFSGRDKSEDRKALEIDEKDFTILVFGGSQGADTTNVIGEALADKYAGSDEVCIIWGTGERFYEKIMESEDDRIKSSKNIRIFPYLSDMPRFLSASDISISRSGALSVAETAMAGRVAIFVPSPNVTEDHQYYNAKALADAGGAFIVREDNGAEATVDQISDIIEKLRGDRSLMDKMSDAAKSKAPVNATDIIYEAVMDTYKTNNTKESKGLGRR